METGKRRSGFPFPLFCPACARSRRWARWPSSTMRGKRTTLPSRSTCATSSARTCAAGSSSTASSARAARSASTISSSPSRARRAAFARAARAAAWRTPRRTSSIASSPWCPCANGCCRFRSTCARRRPTTRSFCRRWSERSRPRCASVTADSPAPPESIEASSRRSPSCSASAAVLFTPAPAPSEAEMLAAIRAVRARVAKLAPAVALAAPLAACAQLALARGELRAVTTTLDDDGDSPLEPRREGGAVDEDGYNLEASVRIDAESDFAREHLLRYCARPPVALSRLVALPANKIGYRIKKLRNGRSKLRVMTPVDLLARLAALVPPPRHPLVRNPRHRNANRRRSALRRRPLPARPLPLSSRPPSYSPPTSCESNTGAACNPAHSSPRHLASTGPRSCAARSTSTSSSAPNAATASASSA